MIYSPSNIRSKFSPLFPRASAASFALRNRVFDDPPRAAPAPQVPLVIERTLQRLRGLHVKLSLFELELPSNQDATPNLTETDDPTLLLGVARKGSLAVLYIRPEGQSDVEASDLVAEKLRLVLQRDGSALAGAKLSAVHRAADALSDGASLFAELAVAPKMSLSDGSEEAA